MIRHLWKHRELIWQFTLRNVELRHRGSHLGLAWSFLNPLLMLGLYFFVFGYIFGGRFNVLPDETRADYALGIFLGLTIFHLVAEVLSASPTVILANPNFVKKVVFPLEILPFSHVGAAIFHFLISVGLMLIGVVTIGPGLTLGVLWLPVILFPLVLMVFGIAWFFAALGVFLRDVSQIMQFLSMSLLYASAIFYSSSSIPHAAWLVLRLNPLLLAVELARNAVLWHQPLNFNHLLYLYPFGVVTCFLGYLAFRSMKPAFSDVL